MVKVLDLRKQFGSVVALDGISFEIGKGEVVGFLGPNGAGKSTAMRIIAGYLVPNEGRVLIDGEDISRDPVRVKAKIGYLPERPPLYDEMSVEEYLRFVAQIRGVSKKDITENMDYALSALKLGDVRRRIIRNLSKGYKQRAAIAGALVHRPEVLILDEPTVGLDPAQIVEVRELIAGLKAEERTLILSSHILSEVEQVCGRAIIVHRGEIASIVSRHGFEHGSSDSDLRVELVVARQPELVVELLDSFAAVKILSQEKNKFLLSLAGGKRLREEIASKIAGSISGLLSFVEVRGWLEDIFMRVTRDDFLPAEVGAHE